MVVILQGVALDAAVASVGGFPARGQDRVVQRLSPGQLTPRCATLASVTQGDSDRVVLRTVLALVDGQCPAQQPLRLRGLAQLVQDRREGGAVRRDHEVIVAERGFQDRQRPPVEHGEAVRPVRIEQRRGQHRSVRQSDVQRRVPEPVHHRPLVFGDEPGQQRVLGHVDEAIATPNPVSALDAGQAEREAVHPVQVDEQERQRHAGSGATSRAAPSRCGCRSWPAGPPRCGSWSAHDLPVAREAADELPAIAATCDMPALAAA